MLNAKNLGLVSICLLISCSGYKRFQVDKPAIASPDICVAWPKDFALKEKLHYWIDPSYPQLGEDLNGNELLPPDLLSVSAQITYNQDIKRTWSQLLNAIDKDGLTLDFKHPQRHVLGLMTAQKYHIIISLKPSGKRHTKITAYGFAAQFNDSQRAVWLKKIMS